MYEPFVFQNHQIQQNDLSRLLEIMKITYRQSIERLDVWSQDLYSSNISSYCTITIFQYLFRICLGSLTATGKVTGVNDDQPFGFSNLPGLSSVNA